MAGDRRQRHTIPLVDAGRSVDEQRCCPAVVDLDELDIGDSLPGGKGVLDLGDKTGLETGQGRKGNAASIVG